MNAKPHSLYVAIVPAAGVGKRMQADCPKQYLTINSKTILEHTVEKLLSHESIDQVIIALSKEDPYFQELAIANHPQVKRVEGGKERVDSVLAGLKTVDRQKYNWALVHDAARPCITDLDISSLIDNCIAKNIGGILASPVKDTMKRTLDNNLIEKTECREQLWHALTPQFYPVDDLHQAIEHGLANQSNITDESSAIELFGLPSQVVAGRGDNIKITQPDDLAYATFILSSQS